MLFIAPNRLWLLLLLIPALFFQWRNRHRIESLRFVVMAALRSLFWFLLILALARPVIESLPDASRAVVVVDISPSLSDDDLRQAALTINEKIDTEWSGMDLQWVLFNHQASHINPDDYDLSDPEWLVSLRPPIEQTVQSEPTNLTEALRLSGALVDGCSNGAIFLFTDARVKANSVLHQIQRLSNNIRLTVYPFGQPLANEIILRSVIGPTSAAIGETVQLLLEVDSSLDTTVLATISNQQTVAHQYPIELHSGLQQVPISLPLSEPGTEIFQILITGSTDTIQTNNACSYAVHVYPPDPVYVLESNPLQPATELLHDWLDAFYRITPVQAISDIPAADQDNSILIIADTPAEAISQDEMQQIHNAVANGMGLLVTGGKQSLGAGGYYQTPLAEVLPVDFSQTRQRRDPSATLVIIIDTSGSMIGPRFELAREVARLAIARLKPHDKVGIVEFYGSKRWAAPIQPASNSIDIQRALNRLSAGGGTVILPAIEEAYYALQNVNTRTRHVLVLTDGGVETGQFEPLIRNMTEKRIVLSTVLVGPDTHSSFLASLAQWGRGRFYCAPDRYNLPEIIVKQPESSLLSPFIEQTTAIHVNQAGPLVNDIDWQAIGAIDGYVETTIKPTGESILSSSMNHPILAGWQYGLGRVMVFTSQLAGSWTESLANQPDFKKLISNVLRDLKKPDLNHALLITGERINDCLALDIHNASTQSGYASCPLKLNVLEAGRSLCQQTIEPIRPGQWSALIHLPLENTYEIQAALEGASIAGQAAIMIPAAHELFAVSPDLGLIERMNHAVRKNNDPWIPGQPRELWPLLTVLTLILLLASVLLRRIPWPTNQSKTSLNLGLLLISFMFLVPATSWAQIDHKMELNYIAEVDKILQINDLDQAQKAIETLAGQIRIQYGSIEPLLRKMQDEMTLHPEARTTPFLFAWLLEDKGDLNAALDVVSKSASDQSEFIWLRARLEEKLGRLIDAIKSYQCLAQVESRSEILHEINVRLAMLNYSQDDFDNARICLKQVLDCDSDKTSAGLWCARIAGFYQDEPAALAYVRSGEEQNYLTNLWQGLYFLHEKNYSDAIQAFQTAEKSAIHSWDRNYALERIVAAARQSGQLSDLVDQWKKDPDLSNERLIVLFSILRELEHNDEVLSTFEQFIDRFSDEEIPQTLQHDLLAAALETGDVSRAEELYLSMIDKDPDQSSYYAALIRLWLNLEQNDKVKAYVTKTIAQMDQPGLLLSMANLLARLSLDDLAMQAADKAGRYDLWNQTRSGIFKATLFRDRGQADYALALLAKIKMIDSASRSQLLVAEAFERFGDYSQALELYFKIANTDPTEDIFLRIGWLLEQTRQFDQAYPFWLKLWQETNSPGRLRQAGQRVLELAARSGKLADLAIGLEEKIDDGTANNKELELLVDIYTRIDDPVSAAEILFAYGRRPGVNRIETMKRLVQVYISCMRFGQTYALLQDLLQTDPDNAIDYLQQMAVIAIERRQPRQAYQAIEMMHKLPQADEVVEEFSAGVLSMLELHEQATRYYNQLLEKYPERVEAWLLWAKSMKAAGQIEPAVGRFLKLLDSEVPDDLFAIAVDGLLNLEASPAALNYSLRQIYRRLAISPEKVFLYQLAVDVLDTLNQKDKTVGLLELALAPAGQRRSTMLRELMDICHNTGRTEQQIEFGQCLLALGDQVPPQVFLDLGEALVQQGNLVAAERFFYRAATDADYMMIQRRVAEYYEQAGYPAQAERIIRDLLATRREDVSLLLQSASLLEQQAQFSQAYERYHHAVTLLLSRIPGSIEAVSDYSDDYPSTGSGPFARLKVGGHANELTFYGEAAFNGMLHTAVMTGNESELVDHLMTLVCDDLSTIKAEQRLQPDMYLNPRVYCVSYLARYSALACHYPDRADKMDTVLLQYYPDDQRLRKQCFNMRCEWGLWDRALSWPEQVDDIKITGWSAFVLLNDPARHEQFLNLDKRDPRQVVNCLPHLIVEGQDEMVIKLLDPNRIRLDQMSFREYPVMVAGALSLDHEELARVWLNHWLDYGQKNIARPESARQIEVAIRMLWGLASPAEKTGILDRVIQCADLAKPTMQVELDLLGIKLADLAGGNYSRQTRFARQVAEQKNARVAELCLAIEKTDSADRISLFHRMVQNQPPANQRSFILDLITTFDFPEEASFADEIVRAFQNAPRIKVPENQIYTRLRSRSSSHSWCTSPTWPKTGWRLAEILLQELPGSVSIQILAATARNNAGQPDQAYALAQEALESILAVPNPDFQVRAMLLDLVKILSPVQIDTLLQEWSDRREIEGDTAALAYATSIFLERIGKIPQARDACHDAFVLGTTNRAISRKLITLLDGSNAGADMIESFAQHLMQNGMMESLEWRNLTRFNVDLYRPLNALKAATHIESPLAPIDRIGIYYMMGRDDILTLTLRRFLIANRNEGKFYAPFWPWAVATNGMNGYFLEQENLPRARLRLFEGLAPLEFSPVEFQGLLVSAPPLRKDVEGIANGVVAAMRYHGRIAEVLKQLNEYRTQQALNLKDLGVLLQLMLQSPEAVSADLKSVVNRYRYQIDMTDTGAVELLGEVYRSIQDSQRAVNLYRWLVSIDMVSENEGIKFGKNEHLENYLSMVPAGQRPRLMTRYLALTQPLHYTEWSDSYDARRINLGLRIHADGDDFSQLDMLPKGLLKNRSAISLQRTQINLAHYYLSLNHLAEYQSTLRKLLSTTGDRVNFQDFLDLRSIFSDPVTVDQMQEGSDLMIEIIRDLIKDRVLSPYDAACILCLMVQRCSELAQAGLSERFFDLADALTSDSDGPWLWVADAARLIGKNQRADQIEMQMLKAKRLPVIRISPLLDRVETESGRESADILAYQAADYTDHPDILTRAQRQAQKLGNTQKMTDISSRLKESWFKFRPGYMQP